MLTKSSAEAFTSSCSSAAMLIQLFQCLDAHPATRCHYAHPAVPDDRYVQEVHPDCAWLLLSPTLRGRLHALDWSDDISRLRSFPGSFASGQPLRCCVIQVCADTVSPSPLSALEPVSSPFGVFSWALKDEPLGYVIPTTLGACLRNKLL
jgi:hypothetical protein